MRTALGLVLVALAINATAVQGQITAVAVDQAPPIPGAGHDYIRLLDETVNPGSGSVSIRIQVPLPPGRSLTLPFAFAYDSNAAHHFIGPGGFGPVAMPSIADNESYLGQGGWSYLFPTLSFAVTPTLSGPNGNTATTCYSYANYILTDIQGTSHPLGLNVVPTNQEGCTNSGIEWPQQFLSGSDGAVSASTTADPNTQLPPPTVITDFDGTVYYFSNTVAHVHLYPGDNTATSDPDPGASQFASFSSQLIYSALPDYVETRNGNKLVFADSGKGNIQVTDDAGRTVLSTAGFGISGNTVTASGLGAGYSITWANKNYSWSGSFQVLAPTGFEQPNNEFYCGASGVDVTKGTNTYTGTFTLNSNAPEITSIALPNGQSYQFQYEPTYGMLSKIIYPTGAYVRYQWGTYAASSTALYSPSQVPGTPGTLSPGTSCEAVNPSVRLQHRFISFDGTNEVLQQDFSYTFSFAASSPSTGPFEALTGIATTATTRDLVRGNSYSTTYTYGMLDPLLGGQQTSPAEFFTGVFNTIPVETNVKTTDFNGNLIRNVSESYSSIFVPPAVKTTTLDNGSTSQVQNTYITTLNVPTILLSESKVFDFGAATGSAAQPGAVGQLLEDYKIAYASFPTSPIGGAILDRPCSVVVNDSGSNKTKETDYLYDGGTAVCGVSGTPSVTSLSNLTSHDETNYAASSTAPRGNATTVIRQCFNGPCLGGNPATKYTYDETGQVTSATDANGNITQYSHADNYAVGTPPGNTDAFLTQITYPATNGVTHTEKFAYGYADGQLRSSQDQNDINAGRAGTTYQYNDPFARPTQTNYPDGGQTTISYNDNGPSPTVTASKKIATTPTAVTITTVTTADAIGHVAQTNLSTDPDGPTYSATTYDGLGRRYNVYNPTRCATPTTNCGESTWGFTTFAYDALGRSTTVTAQDGSVTTTSYSGNCTTVTDPAGKARKSCSDGLGRLTQVFEDPAGLNYETDYTYDALGNLTNVVQSGSRQRTFTYDSLSRLTQAINPESGTVAYAYDPVGNLTTKTSPAPNQTGSATVTLSYCYDALNRLTSKAYTSQSCPMASPVASYSYDQSSFNGLTITNGIGRRTGMTDQAGAEAWSYDSMGRPLADMRSINNGTATVSKLIPYTYNLDGTLASVTVPTWSDGSHTITNSYTPGSAGRPLALVTNGGNFVTAVHYTPSGTLCNWQGNWDQNFTTTSSFNNRLQPAFIYTIAQISSTIPPPPPCVTSPLIPDDVHDTNMFVLTYNYVDASGHNNGNVASITNDLDSTRSQSFTYDSLNRLATAETSSTASNSPANCWGEQYGYDPWGNLLSISPIQPQYNGCTQESGFNFTGDIGTNNRITASGYSYDAAGNMIADPPAGTTYTYDAENHLLTAGGVTYTYDGDGKRVMKSNGTIYWYGTSSDALTETDFSNNELHFYYFLDGKRVARSAPGTNGVNWYFTDALGNSRVVWSTSSTDQSDFYPFGGERILTSSNSNHYKFTAKERDSESGLDNFGARYNSSSVGRFMSPDPIFISPARLFDPQGLNLYAYVRNNPLNFTDPTGLDFYLACQTENHSGCGQVDNGSEKIWVQGQTVDGKFQAYDIDMNRDGSGLYSDQFGNDYKGTFDQNGVSFTSVDKGGASGSGRFINGSDETDVNGSGIFSGVQGKFVSDCGGSCQARGSLYELQPGSGALARAEAALQLQSSSWSWLDRLSGAHAEGRQWMDANGRVHVIENNNGVNAGKTELHFEGHPNTGVTERALHMVNAIRDLTSGRAEEQKNLKLP